MVDKIVFSAVIAALDKQDCLAGSAVCSALRTGRHATKQFTFTFIILLLVTHLNDTALCDRCSDAGCRRITDDANDPEDAGAGLRSQTGARAGTYYYKYTTQVGATGDSTIIILLSFSCRYFWFFFLFIQRENVIVVLLVKLTIASPCGHYTDALAVDMLKHCLY